MADDKSLKESFERVKKILTLKPSTGQYTTSTRVRLRDGTTCEVEHKEWKFVCDIGTEEGGNNAGPGPSIYQRGALGSCLAIGYSKWAAWMEVPIDHIEVEVEADVDARGAYGIDEVAPGYKGLRYNVIIESSAPEEDIRDVVETADRHSPLLVDFQKPVDLQRKIQIVKPHPGPE